MMHSYAHASFLWPRPIALAAVVTGNVVIAAADDAAAAGREPRWSWKGVAAQRGVCLLR